MDGVEPVDAVEVFGPSKPERFFQPLEAAAQAERVSPEAQVEVERGLTEVGQVAPEDGLVEARAIEGDPERPFGERARHSVEVAPGDEELDALGVEEADGGRGLRLRTVGLDVEEDRPVGKRAKEPPALAGGQAPDERAEIARVELLSGPVDRLAQPGLMGAGKPVGAPREELALREIAPALDAVAPQLAFAGRTNAADELEGVLEHDKGLAVRCWDKTAAKDDERAAVFRFISEMPLFWIARELSDGCFMIFGFGDFCLLDFIFGLFWE